MRTWKTLLALCAATGIAIFGWLEWSRGRELARLHDRVARLDSAAQRPTDAPPAPGNLAELLAVGRALDGARAAAPDRAATANDPRPSKPLDPEEFAVRIDDAFQREAGDPAWLGDARARLGAKLDAYRAGFGLDLRDLECRASMCRFRAAFPDQQRFHQFLEEFGASGRPWNATLYTHIVNGDDGQIVASSYLAREGSELPRFGE